ncbi:MAG: hypothetical protein FWE03_01885 [Firmicutes bacterium]|nr:hypothetical protein [Bacillota bacterium]
MQKTKGKKVRGIINWIVFLTIAVFLAAFFIMQAISPQLPLNVIGVGFFTIAPTQSMEPDLTHNDLIVVRRTDFSSLEIGDTVTFKTEIRIRGIMQEVYITHNIAGYRVCVESGQRAFVTRGINAGGYDRNLMTEDGTAFRGSATNTFVGVVFSSSRFFGNLFAYFRSPYATLAAILNMFILMIIYLMVKPEKIKKDKLKRGEA